MKGLSLKAVGAATAVVGLGIGLGVPTAGAAVSAAPAKAPVWHAVGPARAAGSVTALTAVRHGGNAYQWAFVKTGNAVALGYPAVYKRVNGGTWAKSSIPGSKDGETFVAATAISPTHVLAFSQLAHKGTRVWLWNGTKWSVIKTFGADVAAASVLGANDVFVFGGNIGGTLGVWHYNGHAWTQLSKTLQGGSATSATSAWAFSGKTVAHYNGKKWTYTNLTALLPRTNAYGGVHLTSVFAASPSDVYAISTGGGMVNGGPGEVVLQYNGRTWHKVASRAGEDPLAVVSGDGHGGVWFPVYIAASSVLLHYANGSGKLTATTLPGINEIESLATLAGSTPQELAGGFAYHTSGNPPTYATIDLYS